MKDPNEVFNQEEMAATIEEPIYIGEESGGCQAGPAFLFVFVVVVLVVAVVTLWER